jgi:hypothetical protein
MSYYNTSKGLGNRIICQDIISSRNRRLCMTSFCTDMGSIEASKGIDLTVSKMRRDRTFSRHHALKQLNACMVPYQN